MNKLVIAGMLSATMSNGALAATEITWWHAMGGQLGETVNQIAADFNASQNDYKITPVYKVLILKHLRLVSQRTERVRLQTSYKYLTQGRQPL